MSEALLPTYNDSRAVIVGVNAYKHCSPLGYAVNDATAVRESLCSRFGFDDDNVLFLTDEEASRQAILDAYLSHASTAIDRNDRLIFFFAGHGHTVKSHRSEVGFLVPHDGDLDRIGSLIRWDELTRNADLIPAKHILFVMDACYGGLAIQRALKPGAMRFLNDMLVRQSRQVITAGKADEPVADLGGPRPGHSVFSGHFLDAIDGAAEDSIGLITANGIMSYVYRMVGVDEDSQQTPHYGYLQGDGDLILKFPVEYKPPGNDTQDMDQLVSVPATTSNMGIESKVERAKELLSEERRRIALHDLFAQETRSMMSSTSADEFSPSGQWSKEEFANRLQRYELATHDISELIALACYWGQEAHADTIRLPIRRYAGTIETAGGLSAWLKLRWYPIHLMVYYGGIAAIASENYVSFLNLLTARIPSEYRTGSPEPIVVALPRRIIDLHDMFKSLERHERHYTPVSEYMYKHVQPSLDDLLFLGNDYETVFDRFEIFYALEHASRMGRRWGPAGRFAWKYRGYEDEILTNVVREATQAGDDWGPFTVGLFGGNLNSFESLVTEFTEEFLQRLNWH